MKYTPAKYVKRLLLTAPLLLILAMSGPVNAAESISVTADSTTISEGAVAGGSTSDSGTSGKFTYVRLAPSSMPSSLVSLTGTVSGGCKLLDGGKDGDSFGSSSSLATGFTHTAGLAFGIYMPQTSVYEGTRSCTISFSATQSSDADYNGLSLPSKTITVQDDESAPSTPDPTLVQETTPSQQSSNPSASDGSEQPTRPDVPMLKLVDKNNNELTPEAGEEKITFQKKEPIVLSGTTVPNGEVKLYIFSEPQEATVTADETGAWTYTIASIEPGDHRVEVEVTDPETGETSERQEVLAFAVAQDDEFEDAEDQPAVITGPAVEESSDNSTLIPLLLGAVGILSGVGGGIFWWMRRKKQTKQQANTATQAQVGSEASDEAQSDASDTE